MSELIQERAQEIRDFYERTPYPSVGKEVLDEGKWKLAPLGWWNAAGRPKKGKLTNGKILVAGCGTGSEAFTLAREFPDCEIVGVDFSPKSIEIAQKWAGEFEQKNIKFLVADLLSDDFQDAVGGEFDMISCHGVLSYIPEPVGALKNLRACLSEGGSLYLGVNGASHFSTRARAAMPFVGMEPEKAKDLQVARKVLSFFEELANIENGPSTFSDTELEGEVFPSCLHNLPLKNWIQWIDQAGLSFVGAMDSTKTLSRIKGEAGMYILLGQDMATAHVIADELYPSAFHKILLSAKEVHEPPLLPDELDDLVLWRPIVELWDRNSLKEVEPTWEKYVTVNIHVPGMYENFSVDLTHYHSELLRRADGEKSLREMMDEIPFETRPIDLLLDFSRLYYSGVLNFLPPIVK